MVFSVLCHSGLAGSCKSSVGMKGVGKIYCKDKIDVVENSGLLVWGCADGEHLVEARTVMSLSPEGGREQKDLGKKKDLHPPSCPTEGGLSSAPLHCSLLDADFRVSRRSRTVNVFS